MKRPLPQKVSRPDVLAAIRASLPKLPSRIKPDDADRVCRSCVEYGIFELCRRLKGLPHLHNYSPDDLQPVLVQWCQEAVPIVGLLDEIVMMAIFAKAWPKVKYPMGPGHSNPLQVAINRAWAAGPVPELRQQALRYSPQTEFVAKVLRELQRLQGPNGLIFMSGETAATLIGKPERVYGRRVLQALEQIKLIECVKPGNTRRASRYRYLGIIPSLDGTTPLSHTALAPAAPRSLPPDAPVEENPDPVHSTLPQSIEKFRSSREWRHASLAYLLVHCRCEAMDAHPTDPPLALEVHHRQGLATPEGWSRRLDPANLMSVCEACHLRLHAQGQPRRDVA